MQFIRRLSTDVNEMSLTPCNALAVSRSTAYSRDKCIPHYKLYGVRHW